MASVQTTVSDNSGVTFILSDMDFDISMVQTVTIDRHLDVLSMSAHSSAELDISYSDISGVFRYSTDAIDVSDTLLTDMSFAHVSSQLGTLSIKDSVVDSNTRIGPFSGATIEFDVVRHLAQEIFGSYTAVDIFQNESALRADVSRCDLSFNALMKEQLDLLGTGTYVLGNTDYSGNKNFAREITRQLLSAAGDPRRIQADLSNNHASDLSGNQTTGLRDIPFRNGDIICMKVNYQFTSANSVIAGAGTPANRNYIIKLKIDDNAAEDAGIIFGKTGGYVYDKNGNLGSRWS